MASGSGSEVQPRVLNNASGTVGFGFERLHQG